MRELGKLSVVVGQILLLASLIVAVCLDFEVGLGFGLPIYGILASGFWNACNRLY